MGYDSFISHREPLGPSIVLWSMLALLLGIAGAGAGWSGQNIFLVAGGWIVFSIAVKRISRTAIVAAVIFLLFGAWYYQFYFSAQARVTNFPEGKTVVRGEVSTGTGVTKQGGEYFSLRLSEPYRGEMRIISRDPSYPNYLDTLEVRGTVRPSLSRNDSPVFFADEIRIMHHGTSGGFAWKLLSLKETFVETLYEMLPRKEAALAAGITLGEKSGFSASFRDAMQKSGTTHIVALSGYNISILAWAVFGVFLWWTHRRVAFFATTFLIVTFVAMTGAEESVVRAAIMGLLLLLAREMGRMYSVPHAILFSATLMVLFSPRTLFAPGFQLSFASVLGLIYIEPVFRAWFENHWRAERFGGMRDQILSTASAQCAVIPFIMFHFGSFSFMSFFANILILPFMPLTMFFGFLTIGTGILSETLAYFSSWFLRALLLYEDAVIRAFSRYEFFSAETFSPVLIGLYALLFFSVVRYYRRRA